MSSVSETKLQDPLNIWSQMISQSIDRSTSYQQRRWICASIQKPLSYTVCTTEELRARKEVTKLPFDTIISISQNTTEAVIKGIPNDSLSVDFASRVRIIIQREVHECNCFESDAAALLQDTIKNYVQYLENVQLIFNNLVTLYNNSCERRRLEKTASVWGWIKYYICYWLNDKKPHLLKLQTYYKIDNPRLLIHKYVEKTLLQRLKVNAQFFEEEIGTTEETWKQINKMEDVRRQWLTKYHPDRFKIDNIQADTYLKRVLQIYKLWEVISNPSSPATAETPLNENRRHITQ